MNLKNKVVLITGSSSGIGRTIAQNFSLNGAKILIHFKNDNNGALSTLKEIKKHSSGKIYQADLSKLEEVKRMFSEIRKDFKKIDILVNNAGHIKEGDIFENKIWQYEYENIFLCNLYSTQEFLKIPSKQQRKIINISSIYGGLNTGSTEYLIYSVFKGAINNLTVNLSRSLGNNVLVNAISPGYTWTNIWKGISKKEKESYSKKTLIKRFIQPEEIAHIARLLAENDAITGQIINVDGGVSLINI
ncbi:MAG: SDR family oxidoreductase [bacterium]|nr:SDR family oxidoreductase [bacterium]